MKKQKVCIIGGGLAALMTAVALSKLNLEIDLVMNNDSSKNINSPRTLAISQNNYNFLKSLKIDSLLADEFWPCINMKLYSGEKNEKINQIFEMTKNKNEKKIFYMIRYSKLIKLIKKSISKNKSINCNIEKKFFSISNSDFLRSVKIKKKNSKYNLIIVCAENLITNENDLFKNKLTFRPYNEYAITTIIKHQSIKNNTARQLFIGDEVLALLPISKNETSIVWSVKKNVIESKVEKNNLFIKNKIKHYTNTFFKKIKSFSNIELNDLNFCVRSKYYKDRILLFGDILHKVHPLTGQGFNMVLRDILNLEKILKNKIDLGLDIGSSEILEEFSKKAKPINLTYSFGIDFLRNCFSNENKSINKIRNKIIQNLNKNVLVKEAFYKIANIGSKF